MVLLNRNPEATHFHLSSDTSTYSFHVSWRIRSVKLAMSFSVNFSFLLYFKSIVFLYTELKHTLSSFNIDFFRFMGSFFSSISSLSAIFFE
jgi:hypothetical protein